MTRAATSSSPAPLQQEEGYLTQLDSLRAIAVMGVCIHHWHPKWDWGGLPIDSARVQLFFAMSGFLITMILLKARDRCDKAGVGCGQAIRAFYVRRILRIWPLYFLVVLISTALNLYPYRETFWWNATFLTNFKVFLSGQFQGITTHFWSLAVEEQFYLVWPLLVLFIPRKALVPVLLGLCVILNLAHCAIVWRHGANAMGINFLPTVCANTLIYGSILAHYRRHPSLDRWASILGLWIGIPLAVLVWFLNSRSLLGPFGMSLQRVALALILGWALLKTVRGVKGPIGAVLNFPPLLWIGRISFGIYIIHNTPLTFMREFFQPYPIPALLHNPVTKVFLLASITIALSALSYYFFEKPVNSLKRNFPYAPRERESATPQISPGAPGITAAEPQPAT